MKKFLKVTISSLLLITTLAYFTPIYAATNKETVFSKLKNNGEKYKTIVTTNEDEEITQEDSDKELPIETKITYKLNGEDISAEDLAGKDGKVTIKIECKNKSVQDVYVNGTMQEMYTPFVVALGTVIDNENNKNIEAINGEIIENGNKSFVVGMVLPGLNKSLNLTGELSKIEIPEYVEISMDAKDFQMKNIMMYASPRMLTNNIDWNKFSNLFDKVNQIQAATSKIQDGANKLAEGTEKLETGSRKLSEGISTANAGSKKILAEVQESIKKLTADNSNALDNNTLNEIGAQAKASAESTISGELNNIGNTAAAQANETIKSQLKTIGKQASVSAVSQVSKEVSAIAANAKAQATSDNSRAQITKQVKASLNNKLSTSIESAINSISANSGDVANISVEIGDSYKNSEEYKSLDAESKAKVDVMMQDVKKDANKKATEAAKKAATTAKKNAENSAKQSATAVVGTLVNGLATEFANNEVLDAYIGAVAGGVAENVATAVANQMVGSVANKVAQNTAIQVTGEVASKTAKNTAMQVAGNVAAQTATTVASNVANKVKKQATETIKNQMEKLTKEGLIPLSEGLDELENGAQALNKGATELNEGAKQLQNGIEKFNSEGIDRIVKFINGDLKNVQQRIQNLEKLSRAYNKFSSDEEREKISFISMVDTTSSK